MADVGSIEYYRDSAGVLRELPVAAAPSSPSTTASAPAITSTYSMPPAVDGTNAKLVATGSHSLVSVDAYNARTSGVSIQFYDKAAVPVVGTDEPKWTVYVPGLTPANRVYPTGIRFTQGLAFALIPDDAPGLMAGDIQGLNLGYAP
ncbi:hypothetical protein [Sphingomonas abaci]|uniref:Uncharacterized protein n=1 Tax=Sphingomonas abaci TaxID=237611 RepID=A0A7W7AH32_9SPHN|nr:hypothetical protein [Sphingomonas abaci]MBB4616914.1 hypothetical protein [Sphingomonas abaci]